MLQTRTGMVAALVASQKNTAQPYLILTVWSRGQKPKPTASAIALEAVKSFRGVLLKNPEDKPADVFTPTSYCGLFGAENVFAVLDCCTHNVATAEIFLTQESCEAMDQLVETNVIFSTQGPKHGRKKLPKAAAATQPEVDNPGLEKPEKTNAKGTSAKVMKKMLKEKKAETQLCEDKFRRSSEGRANIKKIAEQLVSKDALVFPSSAIFDETGFCTLKGLSSFSEKCFVSKLPKYFEARFVVARKPELYSQAVFKELKQISDELSKEENPGHSRLGWLVRDASHFDNGTLNVS